MSRTAITIGIDKRDGTYFAARVERQTGSPEVKALLRFDADHFNGHHLLEGGDIIVAIPDSDVMVKKILFPGSIKEKEKLHFEMSQSILDSREDFIFDTLKTRIDDTYLGMILRKSVFQQISEPFTRSNGDVAVTVKGKMRAHALVNGFLSFCSNAGNGLGVIFDINLVSASAAFYYEKEIIDFLSFGTAKYDTANVASLRSLAVEMQMILNFKKASIFDDGISIPLSSLSVTGELFDGEKIARLSELMKIPINRPEINHGYLSTGKEPAEVPLEHYLVALGLTVD